MPRGRSFADTMDDLLIDAAQRAVRYRRSVGERRVAPTQETIARLDAFREPLSQRGASAADVISMLDDLGSPATVATAGGRYFGFVNGSSLPVTVAANWLATAWDQNAALAVMSPTAAVLEEVALGWLVDLFELPPETAGAFVTGATMASFAALAAARHAQLSGVGWDVEADGLFGAPPITVVLGEEAHASIGRALALLGLGRERVVRVRADGQGRLRADALPKVTGPAIVCAQAGNVNTGAFDPLDALCDWAAVNGAWVHVDGAFGLWAAASPRHGYLTRGLGRADSWATDAHKWLNVPYDCGIAFVRDDASLRASMALSAAYLPPSGTRDPMHYGPDASRRARGVDVWAALKFLGRDGVAELVERCCRHAARMAAELKSAGFDVLNDVVLNQVLVDFGGDARTLQAIDAIQRDGTCWAGVSKWHDRTVMRVSVSSWATTDDDVDRAVRAIVRLAG
ncbi:MAG TPA: pyridoxal-dependent decarboxylase [Pseudomonadales bacterium]|nr:pyridoxal-dependent decarboxylase [Pseudomonadales bacterium]